MGSPLKILIIEDETKKGAKISLDLENLAYDVAAVLPGAKEAVKCLFKNEVDIIILDIELKGNMDGIETAKAIQKVSDSPFIYLSEKSDTATFDHAKMTAPVGFISRPFKPLDLQRTIEYSS